MQQIAREAIKGNCHLQEGMTNVTDSIDNQVVLKEIKFDLY